MPVPPGSEDKAMADCNHWQERIAAYADAELPPAEMDGFRLHAQQCTACSSAALAFMESKQAIRRAGNRFAAPAALRARVLQNARGDEEAPAPSRVRLVRWPQWAMAAAALLLVSAGLFFVANRRQQTQALLEFADLHVAALASTHPVEVISTDRHTVKPWFQGRIPFSFDLPELQGSPFTLVGGRIAYIHGEPGAHLIFAYQRHFISAFIFRDAAAAALARNSLSKASTFQLRTWTSGPLRYVVIGDAAAPTIDQLCDLLRHTL